MKIFPREGFCCRMEEKVPRHQNYLGYLSFSHLRPVFLEKIAKNVKK
jgi:hypothetical protein